MMWILLQRAARLFRFIVGRYGAGKSFLIQTLRNYARRIERSVVADADLSPEPKAAGNKRTGIGDIPGADQQSFDEDKARRRRLDTGTGSVD